MCGKGGVQIALVHIGLNPIGTQPSHDQVLHFTQHPRILVTAVGSCGVVEKRSTKPSYKYGRSCGSRASSSDCYRVLN